MAIVTRWFSTAAAGAGDGTSWANRAALFSAGAWSSVVTAFDFSSTDSLVALIGPGTYAITVALVAASFANPPTPANPLLMHGCDGSGVALLPSNPGWCSAQPVDWAGDLPVLATTTNIYTIYHASIVLRLLKFTASGATTTGPIGWAAVTDWVVVEQSTSNTSAQCVGTVARCINTAVSTTGTSWNTLVSLTTAIESYNVRAQGNASASSGNRRGFTCAASHHVAQLTAFNCPGGGVVYTSTVATAWSILTRSTLVKNAGNGVVLPGTAASTDRYALSGLMLTGNGAAGVDAQTNSNAFVANCRARHNTSGNFINMSNWPTDLGNYTAADPSEAVDDAAEYVDAAGFDFRIKAGSTYWGKGIGAGDEPASGGGGGAAMIIGG
jgi:hypothetical protein